jgi:N-acetylmuramoyl-L-alanine amidase-like protein
VSARHVRVAVAGALAAGVLTGVGAGAGAAPVPVVAPFVSRIAGVLAQPAHVVRTVEAAVSGRDELVGVTWRTGRPTIAYRWHEPTGWTSWVVAESDSRAPTPAERAHAVAGTEPLWRPRAADRIAIRVRSGARPLSRLRVLAVGDRAPSLLHRIVGALTPHVSVAEAATTVPHLGKVHTRADWGADESLRRCGPSYASGVRAVVIHHTAQPNDYSRADVPAFIRADYAYHVKARGWCDLGYNLVVDRFGGIWQGRYGGITRAVVGAHAEGFNIGTLGVAFLGNTDGFKPSTHVIRAFGRVAAFAGITWHFRPRTHVTMRSGGSPRYRAGVDVRLPRIMGHRDVGLTDCPGTRLYAELPTIRRAAVGLLPVPKFIRQTVTGNPVHAPNLMTIALRLNHRAKWHLTLTDGGGDVVVHNGGQGRDATLSWNGLVDPTGTGIAIPALPQELTWHATAHNRWGAAHAHGTVEVGLPAV